MNGGTCSLGTNLRELTTGSVLSVCLYPTCELGRSTYPGDSDGHDVDAFFDNVGRIRVRASEFGKEFGKILLTAGWAWGNQAHGGFPVWLDVPSPGGNSNCHLAEEALGVL